MTLRRILLLAAMATASAGAADRASAQGAYGCAGGYGGYGGYGFGAWDVGRLYGVLAQNVPHFAAFPPVYYSVPVPRTYGYSPFAYPPGVMTPEVVVAEPLAIENPYFSGTSGTAATEGTGSSEPAADQTTAAPVQPQPEVILNPYVERAAPALAGR